MRVVSTATFGCSIETNVQLYNESLSVMTSLKKYVRFILCMLVVILAVPIVHSDDPVLKPNRPHSLCAIFIFIGTNNVTTYDDCEDSGCAGDTFGVKRNWYQISVIAFGYHTDLTDGFSFPQRSEEVAKVRRTRGVLDFLFGRFKSCGGCQCGRSNRGGARILGGEFTDTHEFPWLANVHVKSNLVVSGVLINDRYVLTAASQLIAATAPEIKVSLGEYDRCHLDISSTNMSVETVIPFPEFNPESRSHDLALLRLSQPTKFERRISPVCLPNPGSTYLGQVGTLSGWTESKTENSPESRTCRPRKLGLPILGYSECLKSGVNLASFHDDSGCIGVVGGLSLVCEHDVGSSVLYRSYAGVYDLVGILSDVNRCDDQPAAAVFTRVGPHLDWILQQTREACYCTK